MTWRIVFLLPRRRRIQVRFFAHGAQVVSAGWDWLDVENTQGHGRNYAGRELGVTVDVKLP